MMLSSELIMHLCIEQRRLLFTLTLRVVKLRVWLIFTETISAPYAAILHEEVDSASSLG